ncbi:5-oxoprolinase subunit PxpB [Winogradskyella sp. 3972H.M.0a.05]|uniref:5-oxoprolinase subunit PxpB n=1 Tax=Winogradskyella sp. 3972H.M.0a.05 TaxID=2950277 RepID=UPI00339302C6
MKYDLVFKSYNEHSILIEWPSRIEEDILEDIQIFKQKIQNSANEQILYVNSAYNSLLVAYRNYISELNTKRAELQALYNSVSNTARFEQRLWKIPVCYDDTFALDSEDICNERGISKSDLIALHTNSKYTLYFIGFLPGFMYLGGLDKQLHIPRRQSPRARISKGAVGIGDMQTGIYPNVSPGGWNIIGNSPLEFFDVSRTVPCFAKAGDKLQFVAVDLEEHSRIVEQVTKGIYQIESEVIHD